VGTAQAPTAAARDATVAAERQQQAERRVAQSPVVQAFLEAFDATIIPGSIKWAGKSED
jgi:hypothetical protein